MTREYIDREAALRAIQGQRGPCRSFAQNQMLDHLRAGILRIPAEDVAPVVHGRWDDIPNTYMSVASKDGTYHGNATSCSVCHEVNPNAYKTNYCPNCGAKMDL